MTYRPKVYLAGGMEAEKNLGAGWRADVSPRLRDMGYDVLNPCEFEPQQLSGLHTHRLPEQMLTVTGDTITPAHWHQLKLSPQATPARNRFRRYMQRIIQYDLNVVENVADVLLVNWTKGAAKGAGTHHEVGQAYRHGKPVYVVCSDEAHFPGWLDGCATAIFSTMEEALKHLEEEL